MINQIYQLTKPKFINVKYQEEDIDQENHILIRPNYMAVCHADQRYYQGKRDPKYWLKASYGDDSRVLWNCYLRSNWDL